jgi:hypothetical protein
MKTEHTEKAREWLKQQEDAINAAEEGEEIEAWCAYDQEWTTMRPPLKFDSLQEGWSYRRKPKPAITAEQQEVMDLHKMGFDVEYEVVCVGTRNWCKKHPDSPFYPSINYRINPEQLAVYRAWQAGKKIEFKHQDRDVWVDLRNSNPLWAWSIGFSYRIKQEKPDFAFWKKAVEMGAHVQCRCTIGKHPTLPCGEPVGQWCVGSCGRIECTHPGVEYRFMQEEK